MSVILRGGGADTHASASPGAVDYVLDEVKADSTAVAVFDGAASATLAAQSTRVGASSAAPFLGDTAFGYSAQCSGTFGAGVALGWQSRAGQSSVAIGADARALADNSITIGPADSGLGATAAGAIAVGRGSISAGVDAVAVGGGAGAAGVDSVAVGRDAKADGGASVSIGTMSNTLAGTVAAVSIAIGDATKGGRADESIAIGSLATATFEAGVALGANTSATAVGAVALGGSATVAGGAAAGGTDSVAIGAGSKAPNNYDIAIGSGADATGGASSIAIGRDADATAANAIALGHTAVASAAGAIAIGQNATASAADAITIGASYLAGNMVTAKHLSPAAASGVALGTSALYYSSLYVDAIYPRTRLTDYIRLTMTQTSGGGGAWSNSTSANHIVFPGSTAATFSVSSVAAPGSAFSNGSTSTAFAAKYTYNASTAYSRVLVTVSVNNFRGGLGTGNVNMTIGAGATAAGMTTSGPFQFTNAASQFGCAQLTTVLDLSAADRFFGPMWLVESGATVLVGTGNGIETATIVILVV